MSRVIVLDTGPLGLVTNPKLSAESVACTQWLQAHITRRSRVLIPEIADYEVRRELLRANKRKGIARLDDLSFNLAIDKGRMHKADKLGIEDTIAAHSAKCLNASGTAFFKSSSCFWGCG